MTQIPLLRAFRDVFFVIAPILYTMNFTVYNINREYVIHCESHILYLHKIMYDAIH